MFFSKRFVLLVLFGFIPAAFSLIPGVGAYAALAYNLVLAALLIVDFCISPKPANLVFRRETGRILSLSDWNRIDLYIENPFNHRFTIELRDSVPESFGVDSEILKFTVNPGEIRNVYYNVRPVKRGEFEFPDLYVRLTGVLGLCVVSGVIKISDRVKVYPNLGDYRNRNLSITRKNMVSAGIKKLRSMGAGTEFESVREYVPGDDFRYINWNVTARTGQLYTNHYEPEKNQYVYLMMDTSRVMDEEINEITKLDYAVNAAFTVAETVIGCGDNIGLLAFDSEISRFVPAAKGTAHFQRLAESLYNIQATDTYADYHKAFSFLQREQSRQSLVLLFTDPFNFEHAMDIVSAWKTCASAHRVMVICIKNPHLYDEAEKIIRVNEDIFTKSAALKLVDDRLRTFSVLERSGVYVLESAPDRFTIDAVNGYISMKTGFYSKPFQQ
jgi:uncharacterized protein (DUF58 family)